MFASGQNNHHNLYSDDSIRQTDSDAAGARLSAAQKLYFEDNFIKDFVPRAHLQPSRPPLINIGTHARSTGIDALVNKWLDCSTLAGKRSQIVSLGAGSDTRFWRLATSPYKDSLATYVELDFPEITSRKAMAIRKSRHLGMVLGAPGDITLCHGGTGLHSPIYHLLPVDLRLDPTDSLRPLLSSPASAGTLASSAPLLSPSLPTLLLFECVLVYMSPAESSRLVQWFVDYFTVSANKPYGAVLGGIVYEMFGLGDAFGKVMLSNLKSRNVSLPGAAPYPNIGSLRNRFLNHGFTTVNAITLRDIRKNHIDSAELERISKIEMLDEIEELDLVLEHYAVTWGFKLPDGDGETEFWNGWGLKQRNVVVEEEDE